LAGVGKKKGEPHLPMHLINNGGNTVEDEGCNYMIMPDYIQE